MSFDDSLRRAAEDRESADVAARQEEIALGRYKAEGEEALLRLAAEVRQACERQGRPLGVELIYRRRDIVWSFWSCKLGRRGWYLGGTDYLLEDGTFCRAEHVDPRGSGRDDALDRVSARALRSRYPYGFTRVEIRSFYAEWRDDPSDSFDDGIRLIDGALYVRRNEKFADRIARGMIRG